MLVRLNYLLTCQKITEYGQLSCERPCRYFLCNVFCVQPECQMSISASMRVVSKIPVLCMTDLILLLDLFFNIKFYVAHFITKKRVEAHRYTINPCAPS